jgi:hypothetical protein
LIIHFENILKIYLKYILNMLGICHYFIAYEKIFFCFKCFLKYIRSDLLKIAFIICLFIKQHPHVGAYENHLASIQGPLNVTLIQNYNTIMFFKKLFLKPTLIFVIRMRILFIHYPHMGEHENDSILLKVVWWKHRPLMQYPH